MADNRAKTPAGPIKHEIYDEAVEADIDESFDEDIDGAGAAQGGSSIDTSKMTLESIRPSLMRAAGAAGALTGAGALYGDNVTLESVPGGPYKYEGPTDSGSLRSGSELGLTFRPSDDSFVRDNPYGGQTDIAPADWRLESRASRASEDDDTDEDKERTTPESGDDAEALSYAPSKYAALPVSPLIRDLFPMVMEYTPKEKITMDYKLIPFIPEMVPAIGDIDAFIKGECLFCDSAGSEKKMVD